MIKTFNKEGSAPLSPLEITTELESSSVCLEICDGNLIYSKGIQAPETGEMHRRRRGDGRGAAAPLAQQNFATFGQSS